MRNRETRVAAREGLMENHDGLEPTVLMVAAICELAVTIDEASERIGAINHLPEVIKTLEHGVERELAAMRELAEMIERAPDKLHLLALMREPEEHGGTGRGH